VQPFAAKGLRGIRTSVYVPISRTPESVMRLIRSIAPIAVLAFAAACDLSTEPRVPAPIDPAEDSYAPALGIDISTMTKLASGVYIKDKTVGQGAAAAANDSVKVHYTGWLPNGQQFDTSKRTNGKPLEFVVGKATFLPAFENSVVGMQPGGVRQIVIPTGLAYGSLGAPQAGIPPNTNLVFQIEYIERLSAAQ
jgi:FKBP-type peptidyl-prolyl cis-trans isomerase FkpA